MRRSHLLPLLAAAALLAACEDDFPPAAPSNVAPTAAFTVQCATLSCTFTSGSADPDGTIEGYDWDFGDGSEHATTPEAAHTYAAPGGWFTVKLAVTDDDGETTTVTRQVSPSEANAPPAADFTVSCTSLTCTFSDASSGGSIMSHAWDFGDGGSSADASPVHDFAASGMYRVTLNVTDKFVKTGSVTKPVTVIAFGNEALTYARSDAGDAGSRYLLYQNGLFILRYEPGAGETFEFRGQYSRAGGSLEFQFDADPRWRATGTIQGDALVVEYNLTMDLSGFENGTYHLVPVEPPPPLAASALAFARDGDLYLMNADGTGLRRLTSGEELDGSPAWSPDGARIAFTRILDNGTSSESAIDVIGWDGTDRVRLVSGRDGTHVSSPSWSPDGTRIAFARETTGESGGDPWYTRKFEIYLMNGDGSAPVRLTLHRSLSYAPAWSPDGSRIAYTYWDYERRHWTIRAMNADGTDDRAVTAGSSDRPSWSPDGDRILFSGWSCGDCQTGGLHLFTVNADGTGRGRLTGSPLQELGPTGWSPDGGLIAFTREQVCEVSECAPISITVLRLSDGTFAPMAGTSGAYAPSWRPQGR